MATEIKDPTFLWVSCIFVLIANLAVMIALYLYQPPVLKKFSHTFITSIFLIEAFYFLSGFYFQNSRLTDTGYVIVSLFVLFWAILDIFLGGSSNNTNENNQENENNEQNDNAENNDNENPTNDNKFDVHNFDFLTAIFAVIMWVTYMAHGMFYFNDMKGANEGVLQMFFYFVFHYATLQFVYGMFIINQGVSKLFYLIYMTPQAVLWPLASIISYYVNQKDPTRLNECYYCFKAIMMATLLYYGFKMFYQSPKYVDGDAKNKAFNFIFLLLGIVWCSLVNAIGNINNDHS